MVGYMIENCNLCKYQDFDKKARRLIFCNKLNHLVHVTGDCDLFEEIMVE
jgi:hypothetical protein